MNKETETATCGICGGEMVHNVPRLGPTAGFVHKLTGKFECPNMETSTKKENKIADHQIRQYSPYDHTKDTFLTFQEPPKTGWDLYITPEFTLNNIKPVNWFNRKMQELILGFKWKRQKA